MITNEQAKKIMYKEGRRKALELQENSTTILELN